LFNLTSFRFGKCGVGVETFLLRSRVDPRRCSSGGWQVGEEVRGEHV